MSAMFSPAYTIEIFFINTVVFYLYALLLSLFFLNPLSAMILDFGFLSI